VCEVGRVFPRHVQSTCFTGESPLDCPRVAHTLRLYNYLLRFHLTVTFFNEINLHPHSSYYLRNTVKLIRGSSSIINKYIYFISPHNVKQKAPLNR